MRIALPPLVIAWSLIGALKIAGAAETDAEEAPAGAAGSSAETRRVNPRLAAGIYASAGMAHTFSRGGDEAGSDPKPRFAGGGGAYLDFFPLERVGLEGGLGLIGRGARYEDGGLTTTQKVLYMEIALGAKLRVRGFRAAVALGIDFALAGWSKLEENDNRTLYKWNDRIWDGYRRFNLCPRVALGYAIPVGSLAIVPGLSWSIEVLDDAEGGAAGPDEVQRNMNAMFDLALEWGVGG